MRFYEYRHIVGFEETNLVGNVYYVNHILWQGRCRELFLRDYAPSLLEALKNGLAMATTKVSCSYTRELHAFDEVAVRMFVTVAEVQITLHFELWRCMGSNEELVARGEQRVVCLLSSDGEEDLHPILVPDELRAVCHLFTTEQ